MNAWLFYDGWCPLCRFSVARLKSLDWLHRVRYLDFRAETDLARELPTTTERLAEEMHLWLPRTRKLYHGFGAFRWMAWRLPLLWPIAPFLYIPGVPWLGQTIYLWVARNRYSLVPCRDGVCTIQRPGKSPREGTMHAGSGTGHGTDGGTGAAGADAGTVSDDPSVGSATGGRRQPG
jgi:predicted DCC family thiol-disulfide oxidoreductase YuxK